VIADRDMRDPALYDIRKLPTLGGNTSRGNSINEGDWIAGYSTLADNLSRHAALWRDGQLTDLGTLGGASSNVVWPGQNDRGAIVGISETDKPDSLHEDWSCSSFLPATGNVCRGFVWEEGRMRALPTFGGTNGFATGVNDRGEVVGWAETKVHDPTCKAPDHVLQFRAAIWNVRTHEMRQLRPLYGDSTSAATAINDEGQAVGISGDCDVDAGEFSARHAVMWDHGRVMRIGDLGGVAWNTPMDINEAGDVVGFSDPPGDAEGSFIAHAFFWSRRAGVKDLGLLPGDATSQALGINSRRQIVGESCSDVACRAVLWENGRMYDLNPLMGSGFADSLASAQDINDDGVITGRLVDAITKLTVPFVATPRRVRH
jgi:probable HAF family extracellular repeat protein